MEYATQKKDVWFVTFSQLLDWMKNPGAAASFGLRHVPVSTGVPRTQLTVCSSRRYPIPVRFFPALHLPCCSARLPVQPLLPDGGAHPSHH